MRASTTLDGGAGGEDRPFEATEGLNGFGRGDGERVAASTLSAGDGAIFEDGDAPSQLEPSMRSFGRRVLGTGGRSAAAAAFGAFVEAAAAFFFGAAFTVAFFDGTCLRTTGPSDKSPSE